MDYTIGRRGKPQTDFGGDGRVKTNIWLKFTYGAGKGRKGVATKVKVVNSVPMGPMAREKHSKG